MGNYSFLRAVRNNPEKCIIDWEHMQKDGMKHYHFVDYLSSNEDRPKTLQDMAERWNESKFFGYMNRELIESLIEFCKGLVPYGCNPRLFYEYEGMDQICCIEFVPGTGIVNIGVYDFNPIMINLPRYPQFPSELSNEWSDMYRAVEQYVKKYCIDNHPWCFERLE